MLSSLHVKNIALIQEEEINFGPGLNILTGETGAGKSIIIGSINAALGAKNFKDFVRQGADYALVELVFLVDKEQEEKMQKLDISVDDGQVIITRKMSKGRSISRINGETVPVSLVREVASALIDIHGQHEHQSLLYKKNHLKILDEFAREEVQTLKEENERLYVHYQECKKKLQESQKEESERIKEADFLTFEIEEIEEAHLQPGEDEKLEQQYRKLSNGKQILESVGEIGCMTGADAEEGAASSIGRAVRLMGNVVRYDESLQSLYDQLLNLEDLIGDFNRELSEYQSEWNFDESEFWQIEERLNLINRLKGKYGNTIEAILDYQEQRQKRLAILQDYDNYVLRLQEEYQKAKAKLLENAQKISEIRKKYATGLALNIQDSLIDMNFLDVQFEIQFEELEEPQADGMDEICFLISTNPGEPVRPLGDVASGGELSRIMLAIKTVLAEKDDMGTLIFDEIDVGISGRTAQKVSEKMAVIAKHHQVICITHLAQIAAMADHHFVIEKYVENQNTITAIQELSEEEMVRELARILGGAKITRTVLENAREMKELAIRTKTS
ncbi:MAG: DNA repair protein RecN [Lachnospiraceae bacterium]|nr:DNA repair protein RecN [Robinsoniella sp.]MDY3766481.1 DNA repair protein RecN [Lachnospiraceae bacterium]